ncbi:MAG: 23S rRNA (guanosine(2251)-2'-O)-methyltransferase RlmB [Deltaproteobacteria bacterium]|nr:23S rRNA (guanosine(2251)-2'-O)-methyltransferase RlmB [Deltaproteobacteria bacterium]
MRRPPRPGPRAQQRPAARPPRQQRSGTPASTLDPELCVVGRHPVEAVLEHQRARAERLYVQGGAASAPVTQLARRSGVPVEEVDAATLDTLAGRGLVHQGAVLRCAPYPYLAIEELDRAPNLTLVLDGVEDPRNLGAAARAAFALGASLVVVPQDRAAACTASAHKAAAGALSRLAVARVGNLRRALDQLKDKGAWLVGAEADAEQAPWQVDLRGPVAVVVGGEDRGLRRLTREACDFVVSIPMAAKGTSLNAADAATVLLYEALRQRRASTISP